MKLFYIRPTQDLNIVSLSIILKALRCIMSGKVSSNELSRVHSKRRWSWSCSRCLPPPPAARASVTDPSSGERRWTKSSAMDFHSDWQIVLPTLCLLNDCMMYSVFACSVHSLLSFNFFFLL